MCVCVVLAVNHCRMVALTGWGEMRAVLGALGGECQLVGEVQSAIPLKVRGSGC